LAQGNKPVDKLMRECSARHRERFWELIDMRTASIVLACMVLAGCAGKVWDKPGGTDAELKRTWAACQMGAAGIPQPAQQAPNPSTYTGNTRCYGNSCTTTVTPGYDSSALANSLSNLGHALAKQRYLDNCLIANGWTEVTGERKPKLANEEYEEWCRRMNRKNC